MADRCALVLEGDAVLLVDGTWITFERLLVHERERLPDVWVFKSHRAAHRVRATWPALVPIEIVPLEVL